MGEELTNYLLTIDVTKAMEELDGVEAKRKQVEANVKKSN